MTTDREQVLSKIAKLSKIVNPDSNAFQGEMNNAAALIQKLMDEYAISWEEVHAKEADQQRDEVETQYVPLEAEQFIKGIKQWHWDLAHIIERVTHTKVYSVSRGGAGKFVFFGPQTASEAACQLFAEWSVNIELMSQLAYNARFFELAAKYGRGKGLMERVPLSERTTYFKQNWLQGCVRGMMEAVLERERQRGAGQVSALVLYDEKLANAYKEISKHFRTVHPKGPFHYNEAGYTSGKKVGRSLDITTKKIGGNAPRKALKG